MGAALAAAVLVGGCGEAETQPRDTVTTEATSTTAFASTTVPPDTGQPPPESVATEFMGLTKADAIALAESQGRPWRIAREDGDSFPLTLDYSENRVNFEIDDGTVTLATFG